MRNSSKKFILKLRKIFLFKLKHIHILSRPKIISKETKCREKRLNTVIDTKREKRLG